MNNQTILNFIKQHWLALGAAVIGLILLYMVVSGVIFNIGSILFERRSAEIHRQVDELKTGAAEAEADGLDNLRQADQTRRQYEEQEKKINEKKTQSEKAIKKSKQTRRQLDQAIERNRNAGQRDIPDDGIRSDRELCTRANSLGVRCDLYPEDN